MKLLTTCCLVATTLFASSAVALEPKEVAIIAVKSSTPSRNLAAYYARVRKIPRAQICLIDTRPGEVLSRAEWEAKVRPEILAWIEKRKLKGKIRCLVTTWDVPLKIDKAGGDAATVAARKTFLEGQRRAVAEQFVKQITELDGLLAEVKPVPSVKADASLKDMVDTYNTVQRQAIQRIREAGATAERNAANSAFSRSIVAVGGLAAAIRNLEAVKANGSASEKQLQQLIQVKEHTKKLDGQLTEAAGQPASVERDQAEFKAIAEKDGLIRALQWIDQQLPGITKNETYSSFDSELSLIYWPKYPLLRWQPNLLHHRYDGSTVRDEKPTLMVARIDGPSGIACKNMIDSAIKIEKKGLAGRVYIDARGRGDDGRPAARGSYAEYDQSLRRLAKILKETTDRRVTLDNKPALFPPGSCPQAALYCGWYSVKKYVDAFRWQPGSVGYHIASFEAQTLRNPKSNVWCKRMLENGVTATLGSVYEPYLTAFPLPHEFFPLLMTGKYTLVETFYRTKPYNSWNMVVLGDPLYNPFGRKPEITVDELPVDLKRLVEK
jgi:uncharacterized protein (TIGR03790 family)